MSKDRSGKAREAARMKFTLIATTTGDQERLLHSPNGYFLERRFGEDIEFIQVEADFARLWLIAAFMPDAAIPLFAETLRPERTFAAGLMDLARRMALSEAEFVRRAAAQMIALLTRQPELQDDFKPQPAF